MRFCFEMIFVSEKGLPLPAAQLEVKLQVEYMSFSAHADAKGIMQLIRMAEPRNILLVHGEAKKMEFLKDKIEQEFSEFRMDGPIQVIRIVLEYVYVLL